MQPLPPGVGDRAYFERWYARRDWTYYRPVVSNLVRHGVPGPLLDLGAGTGLLAECAARFGFEATAVDASADALALGSQRFPSLRTVHATLGEPLPFEDGVFQTVVLNQVVEHLGLEAAEATLREALRVLRPGGMAYVASPCRHNRRERDADPTHLHCFVPSELRGLLRGVGFTRVAAMDAPRRGVKWLWEWTGGADMLCATATCRGYKPG